MEGDFGGCKLWRIHYKNTFGKINFEHFIVLNKVALLKKLWQINGHLSNPPMFPPSKVFLYTDTILSLLLCIQLDVE